MPEIPEHRNVVPVQPTVPSRGPAARRGPVRRRDQQEDEASRRRPDDDAEHRVDEYA